MNIHGIADRYASVINPMTPVIIKRSTGFTQNPDFSQVPTYEWIQAQAQIQALSGTEIERLNHLGLQGILCAAYMRGRFHGIVRAEERGGDIFLFREQTWLATRIDENWPTWSKVVLVRQLDDS